MLSCYRASEATDPESFIAEATAVLSRYPEAVARRVSYGLPSESKWLPSIAEIREACDKADAPRLAEERRRAARAHTAAIFADHPAESPERRKAVVAEMRARFADLWEDPRASKPNFRPVEDLAAEYRARPVTLSPALRKAMGIPDKEDAA